MSDESDNSLLGALSHDLADGLARVPPSVDRGDKSETPVPAEPAVGPWRPRQAVVRAERSTDRLSPEAQRIAGDLLAAAGLVAASSSWLLQNGAAGVTLEPGSVVDVGRNASRGAAFLVDHPVVSRLQCRVTMGTHGPSVVNVGSVNPAFVRRDGVDSPVGDEPIALAAGDSVFVGDEVLLFTVSEVVS